MARKGVRRRRALITGVLVLPRNAEVRGVRRVALLAESKMCEIFAELRSQYASEGMPGNNETI